MLRGSLLHQFYWGCLVFGCEYFEVNRGDEGRILFFIYELLKFITERGASFFIAEVILIRYFYRCCRDEMLRGSVLQHVAIISLG